jgi:hypothetical protein
MFRRPKSTCFLSLVKYRTDINTANRLHQGEVTYKRARIIKGVTKVNMVDLHSISE